MCCHLSVVLSQNLGIVMLECLTPPCMLFETCLLTIAFSRFRMIDHQALEVHLCMNQREENILPQVLNVRCICCQKILVEAWNTYRAYKTTVLIIAASKKAADKAFVFELDHFIASPKFNMLKGQYHGKFDAFVVTIELKFMTK